MSQHVHHRMVSRVRLWDIVCLPSGREAQIRDFIGERARCFYLDDGGEVVLLPKLLKYLRPGPVLRPKETKIGKRRRGASETRNTPN